MKQTILKLVRNIYRTIFVKASMYKINKILYKFSLMGLGIGNYENSYWSGEDYLIKCVKKKYNDAAIIIFDIGGNIGDYSKRAREIFPNAIIHVFEPHPISFHKLNELGLKYNLLTYNLGCGENKGNKVIYDYCEYEGSEHASLYKEVIDKMQSANFKEYIINIVDLDSFTEENNIEKIQLLKVDAEGHELAILKGAKKLIANGLIDIIQFEFNEMNIYSRVLFKDIYELLQKYNLYRLLPDGVVPLSEYNPVFMEIFAFQNIVAIRKEFNINL